MFFSVFIHSLRRFHPHHSAAVSLHHYRRRIWLAALMGCACFWLIVLLTIYQLLLC